MFGEISKCSKYHKQEWKGLLELTVPCPSPCRARSLQHGMYGSVKTPITEWLATKYSDLQSNLSLWWTNKMAAVTHEEIRNILLHWISFLISMQHCVITVKLIIILPVNLNFYDNLLFSFSIASFSNATLILDWLTPLWISNKMQTFLVGKADEYMYSSHLQRQKRT